MQTSLQPCSSRAFIGLRLKRFDSQISISITAQTLIVLLVTSDEQQFPPKCYAFWQCAWLQVRVLLRSSNQLSFCFCFSSHKKTSTVGAAGKTGLASQGRGSRASMRRLRKTDLIAQFGRARVCAFIGVQKIYFHQKSTKIHSI